MPIDPSMQAKSIGTLTDLDPQRDLAKTLQDAVVAARQLFDVDAAGVMLTDADGQLRWASASDQLAQAIEDNQEVFGQGPCMDAFAHARPAAMHDSRREPHWGEVTTLVLADLQVRSGLSVPGGAGRRPHRHPGHLRHSSSGLG
jgi:GAF domain-containing protein